MPILRPLLLIIAQLCLLASTLIAQAEDYPPHIKPIVEQRCMVCHGCYDAPCQLKLDAWAGLQRGASKDKVYDGTRLVTANLTRLFIDGHSPQDWRDKGFYPVLSEQAGQDVVSRMLELKAENPIPTGDKLPDSFDLSLDRDQQCPKADEFDSFARDYPLWGMPYALPGLDQGRQQTLLEWLAKGAPGVPAAQPSAAELRAIQDWEAFLNGSSKKHQLMSRYIYEHLFIGNLYFSDIPGSGYFQMVRSRTAPGEPIQVIATRRPYDSPGSDKFYYRLQPQRTAVIAKRHMPYALSKQRMARWHTLFLEEEYEVSELPSYHTRTASNPFVTFRELPLNTRYRFMLDEAQFTIMGFIKGPVCRGQVALNVIDDHFWVVFVDPDEEAAQHTAEFLARESKNLRMPSGKSSLLVSLVEWRRYSRDQLNFLKAKFDFLRQRTDAEGHGVDMSLIWSGDGHNDNATLTIFRHKDSASVVKGLVGRQPKTAWVIDYSLLERIHYLLVAGFDVYGNVGHQLETRLYMDFLRMEGEQNFLFFLPTEDRIALRDHWYRDAGEHVKQYVLSESKAFDRETGISYSPDRPAKEQFLEMLAASNYGAAAPRYNDIPDAFTPLTDMTGEHLALLPEVAFVKVFNDRGEDQVYSLIHNNGFANNAQLFREQQRRRPDEDYITVAAGFIGTYPNAFFQVNEKELSDFVSAVTGLKTEKDYAALLSLYGVRRNDPWFWQVSDRLYQYNLDNYDREAGLFDLNRYENR